MLGLAPASVALLIRVGTCASSKVLLKGCVTSSHDSCMFIMPNGTRHGEQHAGTARICTGVGCVNLSVFLRKGSETT